MSQDRGKSSIVANVMLLYTMLVRGHLFILLVPILSLCGATEYYVRPTEPTNTSCPAQPCLTLSQYINDSDHYFQSNTVFKFLPGTHHMDRPLNVGNVWNMSLEDYSTDSEMPHLVAQFSCHNESKAEFDWIHVGEEFSEVPCAVIQLHDLQNITLKGVSISHQTPGMSGVVFQYVSNIIVQSITVFSLIPPTNLDLQVGFLIHSANIVEVYSSYAANHSSGFVLRYITNMYITNITARNNGNFLSNRIYSRGIYLEHTTNTTIISPTAKHNVEGMHFHHTTNTGIFDADVWYNDIDGMIVNHAVNTTILSATVMAYVFGIAFRHSANTLIVNANVSSKWNPEIVLENSTNTSLIRVNTKISISQSSHTKIYNSSFTDIIATLYGGSSADPTNLPAAIVLYYSSLHISGCNFTGNNVSSIKAYASNITAFGDLIFSSNRATAGTAFILVQSSFLKLAENSHIYFSNNYATNTGGVFYIKDNGYVHYEAQPDNASLYDHHISGHPLLRSTCFLIIEGSRSQVKLTFVNNLAGKGGDILYGGQVAYGLDGDWNCLQSFKNVSSMLPNGLSQIASDPSRVCLCNGNKQPDCTILCNFTPHFVYPGQSITLSVVVVGQDFGTVAGSVYAQFVQRFDTDGFPQMETLQGIQSVTQDKCNSLKFTIFSKDEVRDAMLTLTATDEVVSQFSINPLYLGEKELWKTFYHTSALDPLMFVHHPVYVHISILPCPAGFMLTRERPFRCECIQLLQSFHGVRCYIEDQTIGRSGEVWVGTLKDDNGTVAGSEFCMFGYCNKGDRNVTLSDPDSQCNYNHSGTLCGGCQPGLSLALGSAQCLPCSNKYLALLIPFALAGPALVFFIKILNLTISQGTINGLIFYANIVKVNEYIFLPQGQTNPLTLFIAWLNLDLGVETCFFHGLTAYTKAWLQFAFPLYISSIAGLIIILAKYSDRVAKVMGNNSVPVLATLFHLSYAKLFRTIITALSYTVLYSSQGHKAVWSADGNVDYLGPKHTPLFAVAVAALLFLWLPYTLLLFLGQWLHKGNCRLIEHILTKLKPFLDAHYGPLKGKHHYWFGSLLLVRALVLLMSALIPRDHGVIVTFSISVFAVLLNYYGLVVYRSIAVALYDISFFMNIALLGVSSLFITTVGGDQTVAAYTLIGIVFVQFLGLVVFKVFAILKRSEKVMACLHRRQPAEDDWELYEEAALLREMESDHEEEDSEGSSSIDSLPTY